MPVQRMVRELRISDVRDDSRAAVALEEAVCSVDEADPLLSSASRTYLGGGMYFISKRQCSRECRVCDPHA